MFLTAANLYSYLRDAGLASPTDILDDEFAVLEIGRRNRNFRVAKASGRALFVKQVPAVIPETILAFLREAACAQAAAEAGESTAIHHVSPSLRRYDPRWHVLVYDAFQTNESLSELALRLGALPDGIAGRLALTLAAIHLETMQPGSLAGVASAFTGEVPWVFIIGEKAELVMPNMSAGCRQVVEQIRKTPELFHGLAQLGQQWRRLCLMHGDIKGDNVLIVGQPDGGREIRLVDWELANLGEPLWDAAGFLCLFLQQWIFSLPPGLAAKNAVPNQPGISPPLNGVWKNAAEFWAAYMEAMRSALPANDDATLRVGWLTAARLVLLTFELLPSATAISPHAMIALQLARYLLADTRNAMRDLLGIPAPPQPAAGGHPRMHLAEPEPWKLPALEA